MFGEKAIWKRMQALEWRMARLEQRLGHAEQRTPEQTETPAAPQVVTRRDEPRTPTTLPATLPAEARTSESQTLEAATLTAPAPGVRQAPLSSVLPEAERIVGVRVLSIVGAAVIIAGTAVFLKMAYDRGWLRLISPEARCIWSAAFGAVLLTLGETARRRFGSLASAGLTTAGLGVIYASALVAHGMFRLIDGPAAVVMLAAVSALGMALGVRSRSAFVAGASIFGGYLAPLVLGPAASSAVVLSAYLTALLISGVLVATLGAPSAATRWLVRIGAMTIGAWWAWRLGSKAELWIMLGHLWITWAILHADALWSAARGDSRAASPAASLSTAGGPRGDVSGASPVSDAATMLLVTLWAASIGLSDLTLRDSAIAWAWPAALALCAAAAVALIGSRFRETLGWVAAMPQTRLASYGFALAAEGLGLAALAAGTAWAGWPRLAAWAAMGVAAIALGRRLRSRVMDGFGAALLLLAALAVPSSRWWAVPSLFDLPGFKVTWMSLYVCAQGLATIAAAAMVRAGDSRRWQTARALLAGVGVAQIALSCLAVAQEAVGVCWAWIALSFILLLISRLVRDLALEGSALCVTLAALTLWVLGYVVSGWSQYSGIVPYARARTDAIGLHPGLWASFAIVALWFLAVSTMRAHGWARWKQIGVCIACGAPLLLIASTSLEISRAAFLLTDDELSREAAVSVWWGVVAVVMIAGGFARRLTVVRHAGLAFLFIATGKAVIFDFGAVAPLWRSASLVGLGLLLLGVSVGYVRLSARQRSGASDTDGRPAGSAQPGTGGTP